MSYLIALKYILIFLGLLFVLSCDRADRNEAKEKRKAEVAAQMEAKRNAEIDHRATHIFNGRN